MNACLRFALLCLCTAWAPVLPLAATTVIPPTFNELVGQADLIVQSRVAQTRSELVTNEHGRVIFTYVTIEVEKSLKGPAPAALELRFLGGTVGDLTMEVSGVPRFAVGQRDVLFIENNGVQYCPLVAVMHGRYQVVPGGSATGEAMIVRSNGQPLLAPADVSRPLSAHAEATPGSPGGMTLAAFEAAIVEELAHVSAN